MTLQLSRRSLLKVGGVAGGGFLLGFYLSERGAAPYPHANDSNFQPNAWLEIAPDSEITLQIHKQEMGQGILTGLVTMVAEELDVNPTAIRTEFAGVHVDFVNPEFGLQITNSSSSVLTTYLPLREAAATVKTVMLEAAAVNWGTSVANLYTRDRIVYQREGQRQAPLGDFVETAKTLPLPERVLLKSPDQFKYIGQFDQRLDSVDKVNGSTQFGIDVDVPGVLTAVLVRCPSFGGKLKRFDAALALASRGVEAVFEIDCGIAVVAQNYWYARRAAQLMEVQWQPGEMERVSSHSIAAEQERLLSAAEESDAPLRGERVLRAEYSAPFLAHACMEPMNATVALNEDHVDVWVSNQAPDIMQAAVAQALGRPVAQVTVHSTFVGGGFGRRFLPDVAVEAALIAAQVGSPVKLIWSREDDIQHDFYRPAARCHMSAELDGDQVQQWRYRVCAPSLMETVVPEISVVKIPAWVSKKFVAAFAPLIAARDTNSIEGAADNPYLLGDFQVDSIAWNPGVPVSFWRSVGNSFNCFFIESFIDEMAHFAGTDAALFRREHLAPNSRQRLALDLVMEKAPWGRATNGRFQGVALDTIKNTVCAQVAEISVKQQRIHIHKLVCVVDCGVVINPDIVKTQVESCIIFGLTAALKGEITINNGSVQQSNFHDYPLLRINEIPPIEVHLMASENSPSGVGECAVAPVAPALANAIFAATKQRLRALPLRLG